MPHPQDASITAIPTHPHTITRATTNSVRRRQLLAAADEEPGSDTQQSQLLSLTALSRTGIAAWKGRLLTCIDVLECQAQHYGIGEVPKLSVARLLIADRKAALFPYIQKAPPLPLPLNTCILAEPSRRPVPSHVHKPEERDTKAHPTAAALEAAAKGLSRSVSSQELSPEARQAMLARTVEQLRKLVENGEEWWRDGLSDAKFAARVLCMNVTS
jgi:hypothetical protein